MTSIFLYTKNTAARRLIFIPLLLCSLCLFTALWAQEQPVYNTELYAVSQFPSVLTDNQLRTLDDWYTQFNDVFQFSRTGPGFLFPITFFSSREEYTAYVASKTGGTAPSTDAVFLRYSTSEKSEIAALSRTFGTAQLKRQLFTQYISYYVPQIPQWLFGGYALLFEHSSSRQNPWTETAKLLALDSAKQIPPLRMFAAQKNEYTADRLYPQAMLLVQFLSQNPDNTYRRLLFDGINALKNGKTPQEAFLHYAEQWIGETRINNDFSAYVYSLKTVNELIEGGIAAYTANDSDLADNLFNQALQTDNQNHTALYYLGLNAYRNKKYTEANGWYKKALLAGADRALINWALGVCAYADGKYAEARTWLLEARALNNAAYAKRVDELLAGIPSEK